MDSFTNIAVIITQDDVNIPVNEEGSGNSGAGSGSGAYCVIA
jgi:hypothetical protein